LDAIIALVNAEISPAHVTYNKNHIALGTSGRNFCWFHPPKEASHCHLRVQTDPTKREDEIKKFEETSLYVRAFQRRQITLKVSVKDIQTHRALILNLFRGCEAYSRGAE
jgi:hypothetical protein